MKDTIHFWDLSDMDLVGGSKLPYFTLIEPPKFHGLVTLLYNDKLATS